MGDADWRGPCRKILNVFKADPQVAPFLDPVPWKELNLFDYPKVVKKPMAIHTVERNWNKYKTPAEFARGAFVFFPPSLRVCRAWAHLSTPTP